MSQLSIKLSDKADALIAQLQKEIFNRRRKKVTAAGVVESLVESGARSQSDKRFATSWTNLIKDIEKAAKLANAHGSKPSSLSDAEWAMVLNHRQRSASDGSASKSAPRKRTKAAAKTKASTATAAKAVAKVAKTAKPATKASAKTSKSAKPVTKASAKTSTKTSSKASAKTVRKSASTTTTSATRKPRPAKRARKATSGTGTTSVAKRMAKAAGRLSNSSALATSGISSPARS